MIKKIKEMENCQFALLVFAVMLLIFGNALDSVNESKEERKSYCQLVSMWEQDAEQGIESVKRNGHPNYKGLDCE